jgi:uncharacterized membrane protein YoaK (UPF0700 family)
MSGNWIGLMVQAVLGPAREAARRAVAIGAFAGGLLAGATVDVLTRRSHACARITLGAEAVLLGGLSACAWTAAAHGDLDAHSLLASYGLPAVAAFSMGLQTVSVRSIGRTRVRTTFITGTLALEVEELVALAAGRLGRARTPDLARPAEEARPKAFVHLGVLLAYAAGGVTGALLEHAAGAAALALPTGAVVVSFGLSCVLAEDAHSR